MLAQRIKELRKARKISQVELGTALGVTKQCVSNWENDNIQPSIEMLVKIATFFEVSTDYLLGLEKTNYIDITDLPVQQAEHIKQIVEDYRSFYIKR